MYFFKAEIYRNQETEPKCQNSTFWDTKFFKHCFFEKLNLLSILRAESLFFPQFKALISRIFFPHLTLTFAAANPEVKWTQDFLVSYFPADRNEFNKYNWLFYWFSQHFWFVGKISKICNHYMWLHNLLIFPTYFSKKCR